MALFIIIKGPSAAGKTVITRKIIKPLAKRRKMAVIPGDFLSHVVFDCPFSSEHLDLKYKNMKSIIENLAQEGYSIIVNDLFRRQEDLEGIVELAQRLDYRIVIFELTAPLHVLLSRNRKRDPLDFIPPGRIKQLKQEVSKVKAVDEIEVDTAKMTVKEETDFILNQIEKITGEKI